MNFSCRDKIDIRICDVFDKDLSDLDRRMHSYILKKLHDLADLLGSALLFCRKPCASLHRQQEDLLSRS